MVGLLSLMSITTTVSVAEPTRGGVPLSIAVTTKLWASTRAQHKVHRCVAICVREQCMHAQHLEHVRGVLHVCTGLECVHVVVELCTASGVSGAMDMCRASGMHVWGSGCVYIHSMVGQGSRWMHI